MKIKPLPPLNSLVAFEASARLLSFTLAADELCVTQGAVSRQIRHLEEYLGKPLFTRVNRAIELTPAGLQYYHAVRSSLTEVSRATAELLQWRGERQITVATTNAMASLWLLPQIPEFQRDHEGLNIRILASDQAYDLNRSEFDLALLYCPTPPPNMRATPLFREEIFPVCSAAYLHRVSGEPDRLFRRTLLELEDAQSDWLSWSDWFERVDIQPSEPGNRIHINNYPMLIQAALNGQGVALAWGHLLDRHLESGALVRPVETTLHTAAWFYLLEPSDRRVKPAVQLFREWLLARLRQGRETVASAVARLDG